MPQKARWAIALAAMVLTAAPGALAQPYRSNQMATPVPAPAQDTAAAGVVNESSQEFNNGANNAAPVENASQEPLEAINPSRAVAFSLGASIGFASYHASDVIEMIDHPLSDADRIVRYINENLPQSVELMCQSVTTARGIVQRERARRDELAARRTGIYRWPLNPPSECDPAAMHASTYSPGTQHINREYYNSLVGIRETWGAQLQALDPVLGAAYRAGVNIAIAEGFASRDTDAASIVANALVNARNDALLLGLDPGRIQSAIDSARPGANMHVLHDTVMSMRMAFEATLANSAN